MPAGAAPGAAAAVAVAVYSMPAGAGRQQGGFGTLGIQDRQSAHPALASVGISVGSEKVGSAKFTNAVQSKT